MFLCLFTLYGILCIYCSDDNKSNGDLAQKIIIQNVKYIIMQNNFIVTKKNEKFESQYSCPETININNRVIPFDYNNDYMTDILFKHLATKNNSYQPNDSRHVLMDFLYPLVENRIYVNHYSILNDKSITYINVKITNFKEMKRIMGHPRNQNTIWHLKDSKTGHTFLVLNIYAKFTILHSWFQLWSLLSWLHSKNSLTFFDQFPQEKKVEHMTDNFKNKIINFHNAMGEGKFFTIDEFWITFQTFYGDFMEALQISLNENTIIEEKFEFLNFKSNDFKFE